MRSIARALSRSGTTIAAVAIGATLLETAILQTLQHAVGHDATAAVIGGALGLIIGTVGTSFKTAAITHMIGARRKSYVPTLGESLRWALARLPTVILTSAMTFLLMMVGFVFLVIPGIVVALTLIVASPVAVMEEGGVMHALRRSRELTEDRLGPIFVSNLFVSPLLFGGYFVAFALMAVIGGEPFTDAVGHVLVPTTPLAALLSSLGIAAMSAFTAVYAAVVYGMLTRKPRKGLGERVARVFE